MSPNQNNPPLTITQVSGSYYADVEASCQLFHVCVQVSEYEVRCPDIRDGMTSLTTSTSHRGILVLRIRISRVHRFQSITIFQFQDFHFLCPNDTVFDQQHLVCSNWFDVDCQRSTQV